MARYRNLEPKAVNEDECLLPSQEESQVDDSMETVEVGEQANKSAKKEG